MGQGMVSVRQHCHTENCQTAFKQAHEWHVHTQFNLTDLQGTGQAAHTVGHVTVQHFMVLSPYALLGLSQPILAPPAYMPHCASSTESCSGGGP